MIKPTFKLEKELQKAGYEMIIGIDEAGKGPLAGPVVAAAAIYKFSITSSPSLERRGATAGRNEVVKKNLDLIRDSKLLSEKQRESLYDFIHEHFYVGVGICDHKTIDRMNIFQASFLAMKKAISALTHNVNRETPEKSGDTRFMIRDMRTIILLDGKSKIPNFSLKQRAIVRGDKTVKSISAASIIAKVTRDRIMLEMHKKYPQYDFDRHKGYGTKLHMEKLKKHGPCEIHRKSFAPVKFTRGEQACQRRVNLPRASKLTRGEQACQID